MNYRAVALIVSALSGSNIAFVQYRRLMSVAPERRRGQVLMSLGATLSSIVVQVLMRGTLSRLQFETRRVFLFIASFGVFLSGILQAVTMRREEET